MSGMSGFLAEAAEPRQCGPGHWSGDRVNPSNAVFKEEGRAGMNQVSSTSVSIGQHDTNIAGILKLPLVSLFVTSWNYARYIGAAIDSIRAQDYPHLEVVIFENASTDDSREVIARHVGDDPRIRVIQSDRNYGQIGAFFRAFDQLHGEFIASIDSDDVLQPDFVSLHVQAHLALPVPVAFTSSNVIEIAGDGSVLSGSLPSFGREIPHSYRGLRPIDFVPRIATVSDDRFRDLSAETVAISSADATWRWAPGTSNVFRRQVLAYGQRPSEDPILGLAIDALFNPFCHLIASSALIGLPLSFYRAHDSNDFATGVTLPNLTAGKPGTRARKQADRRAVFELFLMNVENLTERVGRDRYWTMINQVAGMAATKLADFFGDPKVVDLFGTHFKTLVKAFGEKSVVEELRKRLGRRGLEKVFAGAYAGQTPPRLQKMASAIEWRRFRHRIFRKKK